LIINVVLFAILLGSISFNKEYLRPLFNDTVFLKAILGCFPNFIAAYIISLFFVGAALGRAPEASRTIVYSISIVVFILLTVEEFISFFNASKVFDSLDIVASGVGALMAVLTFELIVYWRKKITGNISTKKI